MRKLQDLRPGPAPSAWERRRRETEAALLKAGRDLFARKGFEATAVSEIAAKAGVGVRTFYRYFPAKEWIACHAVYSFTIDGVEAVRQRPADEAPIDSLVEATRVLEAGEYDEALSLDFMLVETVQSVAGVQHHILTAAQDDLTEVFAERLGMPVTALETRLPAVAATVAYETSLRAWWTQLEAKQPGPGVWELARATLEALRPAFEQAKPQRRRKASTGR